MADPTTSNRGFNIPTTGSDVGTWGTSLNNNFSYIDQLFGGVVTKSLTGVSGNLTLSSSDVQYGIVRLTGTLGANVNVVLPTASNIYTIEALPGSITGAYTITASMAAGAVVGIAPGIPVQIFTDGSNTKFYNPPLPGTYWDYAGGTTPSWITACTNVPWLLCDGSAVSRTTYANLFNIIGTAFGAGDGSTTFNLPDPRNRARVSVGGGRLTSGGSGINGATVGSVGGVETYAITDPNQIPAHNHTATATSTDLGHTHTISVAQSNGQFSGGGGNGAANVSSTTSTGYANIQTTVTVGNTGGGQAHQNTQPTLVSGLTFIKT